MYINPFLRFRFGRLTWALIRHRLQRGAFPEHSERLITREELLRFAAG